jgi:hypothetical protein
LNGTHQILLYGDINLLNETRESVLGSAEAVGQVMDLENTDCMFLPPHRNSGQKRNIKIVINPFKMWER